MKNRTWIWTWTRTWIKKRKKSLAEVSPPLEKTEDEVTAIEL